MLVPLRTLLGYAVSRGVPGLASMALTLACVHTLVPEDYARFSLTLLPVLLAAGFISSLTGQAMLRHGDELTPHARRQGLVAVPLAFSALTAPLAFAFMPERTASTAVVALMLLPLMALADTRRSLLIARGQVVLVLRLDLSRGLFALALTLMGFAFAGPWPAVPVGAQVLAVAAALLLVPLTPLLATRRGNVESRRVDRRYLSYGLLFALWSLLVGALSLAERHIVERGLGLAASGAYAAKADAIGAVCSAIGGVVGSALMPHYLAVAREQAGVSMKRLLRAGWAATSCAAMLCLALVGFATAMPIPTISSMFGDDLPTALALVIAASLWLLAVFVHKPLELGGRTGHMLLLCAGAAFLFVLLAWPLMQWWGATGVALAKAIAGAAYVASVALVPVKSTPRSG